MPKLSHIAFALLFALAPPASGQDVGANLPAMGDSAAQSLSREQEVALGRQIMRDLRANDLVLDDPEATEFLQSLGQRLASRGDIDERKFTFFLVNSADVNAFALPGGYIGINAGLLMATNGESELAGVLAHEIAHVTQRHIARSIEKAGRLDLATTAAMVGAILVGASSGNSDVTEAAIALGSAAQIQGRINFTRANEHEADRVGIGMLAAAGFDPHAMATMFEELERRSRLAGSRVPEFLSTHPVSAARIAEARDRAASTPVVTTRDSRTYGLMRARVRALVMNPNDAVEYFTRTIEAGPASDALHYGRALALARAGRADEAIPTLERLLERNEDMMYFHLALAGARFKSGDVGPAIAGYEHAMRLFPRNVAVTQAYAYALLHTGRGRDALPHLTALLPQPNPDPQLYRLLAMCSGSAGQLADAHYFMSEVHAMNGQLVPAIDQLQLALSIPDINAQQRARAIARLEQFAEYLPRHQRARLDEPIPQPLPQRRR